MLVLAQLLLSLIGLVGALAPKLTDVYFRQNDDAAWVEKNGALLLTQTDLPGADDTHEAMKCEIRLGLEREQIRKFYLSRLKYPVLPAYFSAGVSLVFMLLPAVLGLENMNLKLAAALMIFGGMASLPFAALSVRNALLNIEMSESLKPLVAAGRARYPIDKLSMREKTLRSRRLNGIHLWRIAAVTLKRGRA